MSTPLIHQRDIQKRPAVFTIWEKARNKKQVHWAMECFAESLGVFFYVYFGVGSQVGWVVGNLLGIEGLSSLFQIGMAYAFGIVLAISVCAGTSGGHFNPCVTITMVFLKGFPKAKAVRYIIAQLLGAYIASLLVYNQWKGLIDIAEVTLLEKGTAVFAATQFTPNGPPGAFGNYLLAGQTLPRAFMNEFVNCTLLSIIIWACIDPCNALVPPPAVSIIVAFGYAATIFGFGVPGISLNAARDVGGRLAAMTIWGMDAKGGSYSAITALVNIPATMLGATIYELFVVDSDRVVATPHLDYMNHLANHRRLRREANVESLVDLGNAHISSQEKSGMTEENAGVNMPNNSHV